jgi:hypothetical protein
MQRVHDFVANAVLHAAKPPKGITLKLPLKSAAKAMSRGAAQLILFTKKQYFCLLNQPAEK